MNEAYDEIRRIVEEQRKANLRGPYEHIDYRRLKNEPPPPVEDEEIPEKAWLSHAFLLAKPNSGKTNVIRWRISQLLPRIRDGEATVILLDPKAVLTNQMLTVARLEGLESRTVFIDPEYAPVSVDLFEDTGRVNDTIDRLTRILGTITIGMTTIQRDTLTFSIRALFATEHPTLAGLRRILREGVANRSHLAPVVAEFFEYDFKTNDGRFILSRLNSLLANPVFETLFEPTGESFSIGREMQAGKLIIINAKTSDTLYGKVWIEQVDATIDARLALPEEERTPVYFIIDEAPIFIADDNHFADILDRAREAKIGMFIAAQHMDQIASSKIRNSLYNCELKFVARTNADIHNLCRSMGTTETSFIGTVPPYHFAFHSGDMSCAKLLYIPLTEFPATRKEDVAFFRRSVQSVRLPEPVREVPKPRPTQRREAAPPLPKERRKWIG